MFNNPKPTSNLCQPDFERFMSYVSISLSAHQLSNRGPNVLALEKRLAEFHEVSHCVTFCSGFYALAVCLKLFLGDKTKVLLPSLTYRRMPDILNWANAKPVYVDVSRKECCLTADIVREVPPDAYDLILAPHPIVNCLDATELEKIAAAVGKPIVFDSVESAYETVNGKRVGGFGEAEIFSLHACKLINGFGGGYVTTNNSELAKKMIDISKFGFSKEDIVTEDWGSNFKLNEFHAAMALANLDELEEQVQRNKKIYEIYCYEVESIEGVEILKFNEAEKSSYKNIVLRFSSSWPKDIVHTVAELNAQNILARRYYYPPLHASSSLLDDDFPATKMLNARLINMPCGSFVDALDVKIICEKLRIMAKNEI